MQVPTRDLQRRFVSLLCVLWMCVVDLCVVDALSALSGNSSVENVHRGTSLIRNSATLGTYSRTMPRALWCPLWGGLSLMSEVPLYSTIHSARANRIG